MNDRELIRQLHSDPERGIRQVTEQYAGLIWSVVQARLSDLGTREDVEECVSDTISQFYLSQDRFTLQSGTVKAYLCAIARHKAIDRYEALRQNGGQRPGEDSDFSTETEAVSPEERMIEVENRRDLAAAIEALGHPDREIIIRKYLLGEPSRAIAGRLGLSISAVDTRTHRALKKLRELLKEETT